MTDAVLTERPPKIEPVEATLTSESIAAARALIGVPLRRRAHSTLASRDLILRYSKAIGCRNPLYTNMSHGVINTYWASLLAHPSTLFCFDDTIVAPRFAGLHAIYAGVTFEWYYPIRAGDTITAQARLTGIEEKDGRFCGPMALQTSEVTYIDQHGRVVARATPRILRTPRKAARERALYDGTNRYEYNSGEIDAIMRAYFDEEVRGEKPRYFEEVSPGDALPQVVKGPLTSEDMNLFMGNVGGTRYFRDFLSYWRRHPEGCFRDPETGMPDSWEASLLRDKVAHMFGFPAAHDTGLQRVAWLDCLITNWMGDLAFLRRLDVRLERPVIHGDTNWCRGKVIGKRWDAGRPLVDLELECVNQSGVRTASANATVEMVSHDVRVDPPCLVQPQT